MCTLFSHKVVDPTKGIRIYLYSRTHLFQIATVEEINLIHEQANPFPSIHSTTHQQSESTLNHVKGNPAHRKSVMILICSLPYTTN